MPITTIGVDETTKDDKPDVLDQFTDLYAIAKKKLQEKQKAEMVLLDLGATNFVKAIHADGAEDALERFIEISRQTIHAENELNHADKAFEVANARACKFGRVTLERVKKRVEEDFNANSQEAGVGVRLEARS